MSNETTLSGTDTVDNNEFDAISKAMFDGNMEEVSRLMAAEPAEIPETKPVDDEVKDDTNAETEEVTEVKSDDNTDEVKEVETNESDTVTTEAANAASTAKTEDIESLQREIHRLRSDAGRVPYLQRRLQELERALKARAVETTNPQPKTANTQDVELPDEVKQELDALKEVDPVLARAMEKIAKANLAAANSRVTEAVTTITQADQEAEDTRFWIEQKSELTRLVPQHEQIFALPEYQQWKAGLTPGRRALAESAYAEEVAQAIYAFAADMQRLKGEVPAQAAPVATTTQVVESPEAKALREARQRKVSTSADVKSSTAKTTQQFDADAYFKEQYNKLGKENHILP